MARTYVETHLAYFFICEECGRDNFIRGVSAPQDVQQQLNDELAAEHGVTGVRMDNASDWIVAPDEVTCQFCRAEFCTFFDKGEE